MASHSWVISEFFFCRDFSNPAPHGSVETPDVFSFLKPGKNPALPSSCRPVSLLDTIGKLFESIPLARILCEVDGFGRPRNEQFEFRSKHSTTLLPTCLVERVSRNFGEKLTDAVFLDVAKAFDTVWVDGLLYKLTVFNFPLIFLPE